MKKGYINNNNLYVLIDHDGRTCSMRNCLTDEVIRFQCLSLQDVYEEVNLYIPYDPKTHPKEGQNVEIIDMGFLRKERVFRSTNGFRSSDVLAWKPLEKYTIVFNEEMVTRVKEANTLAEALTKAEDLWDDHTKRVIIEKS